MSERKIRWRFSVYFSRNLPSPQLSMPHRSRQGPWRPVRSFSIFGENLARTTMFAPAGPLPQSLGGLTLSINGVAAPLLFVSPGQINAQAPFGLAIGPAIAVLQSADASPVAIPFSIAPAAPGIFAIQGAVWNADGSVNTQRIPPLFIQ
jgi:uncharacterized protein (TIGR03437 family)